MFKFALFLLGFGLSVLIIFLSSAILSFNPLPSASIISPVLGTIFVILGSKLKRQIMMKEG